MNKRYLLCGVLTIVLVITSYTQVGAQKYNMTYLYGSGNYISMLSETQNTIDEVSPSYFDIDDDVKLKINSIDEEFISEMHNQGKKVVPFISNHWDRENGRAALKNKNTITTELASAIIKYNLDGINVDIENVTEADRSSYTEFVRLLREKLPTEKSIVVSVAANPNNWTTGWHASYDYTALSKYADYLMIMAYDEHYEGGEAGAVASIEFVENSIKYALERVDKSKIVLGIPLYGRYWKEGASNGGKAISLKQVSELIRKCNGNITFDETTQSPKAEIFVSAIGTKPVVNGKTLQYGNYTIWYENEESIKAKLELINKYDIKGAGTWKLGLEESDIWNAFYEYLKKDTKVFDDVENGYWAEDSIKFVKEKGWVNGRTTDLYKPEESMTRAEVAAIICRVLNLNTEDVTSKYTDTSGHWAEKYINAITNIGIVEGYETNEFKPDKYITREEVSKIISNLTKEKEKLTNYLGYDDVNEKMWSYKYIKELSEKQIINGFKDGSFKPYKYITRAEMAKIIYEIYKQ